MVYCTEKVGYVSTETGEIFESPIPAGRETPLSKTGFPDATLDFVCGTMLADGALEFLKEIFGADGWQDAARGTQFYHCKTEKGNVTLLWDGITPGMGTRFELSGQGCREVEGREGFEGWRVLIARLYEKGARFTRVDIALDDHAGLLSLPIIRGKMQAREVATHYKKGRGVWECSLADEEPAEEVCPPGGETLYFGRRDGMSMVRFYDWAAKHGGDEQFVRCELELHKRYAHRLAELLAAGQEIGGLAAQVLAAKLQFKEAGEDKQKGRWQTCEWWEAFLGAVKGLKLSVRPVAGSLNRKLEWVKKYVAPTLALLEEEAEEAGLVAGLIQHGAEKLKQFGRKFERIRVAGWKKGYDLTPIEHDPFWNTVENEVARFLHDYRAAGAASPG